MTRLWIASYLFVGGGLGTLGRWAISTLIGTRSDLPLGTIIVNITGSIAIGFFAAVTAANGKWPASDNLRQFWMVGFFGGYTTFSAFSLQTFSLAQHGNWLGALLNVLLSVVLCLAGTFIGYWLGGQISAAH
jgi:CrcB protein